MSRRLVISDPHFGHENIIKYCNRPFDSVDQMNESLIDNWNSEVKSNDEVICLGDFAFRGKDDPDRFFNRLNGRKSLIAGNHDDSTTFKLGWESVDYYREMKHNGRKFIMFHYPIDSWNGKLQGFIHLFGHVHNLEGLAVIPNRFNMSVEMWDYKPVDMDHIIEIAMTREQVRLAHGIDDSKSKTDRMHEEVTL